MPTKLHIIQYGMENRIDIRHWCIMYIIFSCLPEELLKLAGCIWFGNVQCASCDISKLLSFPVDQSLKVSK